MAKDNNRLGLLSTNPDGTINERLRTAFSGQSPLFNFGIGLLANSGPAPVGTRSTGQVLARAAQFASERQRAAMQNDLIRQQLRQRQQEREARAQQQKRLQGLIQGFGPQTPADGVGPPTSGQLTPQQLQFLQTQAQADPSAALQQVGSLLFDPGEQPQFEGQLGQLFNNRALAKQQGNERAVAAFDQAIEDQLGEDVDLGSVLRVRDDFESDSREFLIQREGFQRIEQAVNDPSPAGDRVLLSGLVQLLDPGARILPGEGEIELSADAGSLAQRAASELKQVFLGEPLTTSQREDFRNQGRQVFERAQERQRQRIEDMRGFAQRNSLPFEDIVPAQLRPTFDSANANEFNFNPQTGQLEPVR